MIPANDTLPHLSLQPTLHVTLPRPVLYATLYFDLRTIRCGRIVIQADHPIVALCQRLVADGLPDRVLIVRWQDQRPACIDSSVHECARMGASA